MQKMEKKWRRMVDHCCQIQFELSTLFQTVFKSIFDMKIKSMFTSEIDI